jgi:hypothetical protein
MKNFKSIRRLLEQAAITPEDTAEFGMQPEMPEQPAMPADDQSMMPAEEQPMLPAEGESSAAPDPMTMTVRDFINMCRETDPLICMGIEAFVQSKSGMAPQPMQTPEVEPDLTFSNQVAQPGQMASPAPVKPFSLDQPDTSLNFPA